MRMNGGLLTGDADSFNDAHESFALKAWLYSTYVLVLCINSDGRQADQLYVITMNHFTGFIFPHWFENQIKDVYIQTPIKCSATLPPSRLKTNGTFFICTYYFLKLYYSFDFYYKCLQDQPVLSNRTHGSQKSRSQGWVILLCNEGKSILKNWLK